MLGSKLRREVQEKIEELAESRELIKQITDTIPDVIYIIDLSEGLVVYVSEGCRSLGYSPEEIYDLKDEVFSRLVHPDDIEMIVKRISEMVSFQTGEIRESYFRLRDANGDWRNVYSRTILFKNGEDGKPLQIMGIIQDITEKVKTEEAYVSEKSKNEELIRINSLLDLFVYEAAHDLKGPIGNLMVLTELIKDAKTIEKKLELQEKYLPIINSLNKTVSALSDVVQVEKQSGKAASNVQFKNVFSEISTELSNLIAENSVEIQTNFQCLKIHYIDSFLHSIFRNLLTNSIKYKSLDRQPVVIISTKCVAGGVLLSFKDNGIGMEASCCNEIFKPFTRFSDQSEGTGIGLYLVNNMVTKNNGHIQVESQKGVGTAFHIFLRNYED